MQTMRRLSCTACCSATELRFAIEGETKHLALRAFSELEEISDCLTLLEREGVEFLTGLTAFTVEDSPLGATHLEQLGTALRLGRPAGAGFVPKAISDADSEEEAQIDLFGGSDETDNPGDTAILQPSQSVEPLAFDRPQPQGEVQGLVTLSIVRCGGAPSDAWSPLWQGLPSSLTEVNLSENGLNDHAAAALCGALRQMGSCPSRLILRGNRCKDIDRLCHLITSGGLRLLDLSENLLNDKSVLQLCEALPAPTCQLSTLSLAGNRRISSTALAELFAKLPKSSLRNLTLAGTSLCDQGSEKLAEVLSACNLDSLDISGLEQLSSKAARRLLVAAEASLGVRGLVLDESWQHMSWQRCMHPKDIFADHLSLC